MKNNINTFDFILKNGAVITVKCNHCTLKHIGNELTQFHLEGISEESDFPMYIRLEDISAVVQHGAKMDGEEQNDE